MNIKNFYLINLLAYPTKNKFSHRKFYGSQYEFFSNKIKVDPYFVLDLHRGAEFREIKRAYFKLARQYHPDLNKNDEVSNNNDSE